MMVDRERIHRAIDQLSAAELEEVEELIESFRLDSKDPDWFGKLRDSFAPVRDGIEASGMTDDEVNAILDAALDEVRRERKA